MELKSAAYHKKVRTGFLKLAELRNDIVVIDAKDDVKEVHNKIVRTIEKYFK
jgi:thymidylate kinase